MNQKAKMKNWIPTTIFTSVILTSSILIQSLLPITFTPSEIPVVKAAERSRIDVFDSSKQTVIGTLENTDDIQNQLQKTLFEALRISPSANIPFNDKEIVYRIPIQPPIVTDGRHIIEAFVIKMSSNETVLVSFDNHDKSMIYRFPFPIPLLHTLEKQSMKQE